MATEKKARSISLDISVEAKLVALCSHLGVNPHAYLLNEIGKCVNRDYMGFQVAANQQASMDAMVNHVVLALKDSMKDSINSDVVADVPARIKGNSD